MDGHQYEHRCAAYLKSIGYTNVTVTPGSGDQGIDILANKAGEKYGIQCKYYEGSVGNKAVQEAFAGSKFYDCDQAMVITNSTFTRSAVELAQKLGVILKSGVDAIVLQNAAATKQKAVSPADVRRARLEQIEQMLQERDRALRAKYPEDPAQDAQIDQYVHSRREMIRLLGRSMNDRIRITAEYMQTKITLESMRSLRDPRLTEDKENIRAVVKSTGEHARIKLEEADAYATEQLSMGIPEASVEKLIDLIEYIYREGTFEASINSQVIAKTNWTAKHTKILEKWRDLRRELPSAVAARERAAEDFHIRPLLKTQRQTNKQLLQVREAIEELQAAIASRESGLSSSKTELAKIRLELEALQRSISTQKRLLEEGSAPHSRKLAALSAQIETLTEREANLTSTLNSLGLLAFTRKKALRAEIARVTVEIGELTAQRIECERELQVITDKHQEIIRPLQAKHETLLLAKQQLQSMIRQLEEDLKYSITEKKLAAKEKELAELTQVLSECGKNLETAHEDYLLHRYEYLFLP